MKEHMLPKSQLNPVGIDILLIRVDQDAADEPAYIPVSENGRHK